MNPLTGQPVAARLSEPRSLGHRRESLGETVCGEAAAPEPQTPLDRRPLTHATSGSLSTLVVRLTPNLTDVVLVLPWINLFVFQQGAKTLLADGGTGVHIRAGEWMLQHGRVPWTDPFSFTKPGQPWFAWEWAWELAAAGTHRWAGLTGVVWLHLILLSVIGLTLFQVTARQSKSRPLAFGLTAVALAASSSHWLARPHLLSWLFTLVAVAIVLEAEFQENRRWLWFLPPLTLLWANIHGSFALPILMCGLLALGRWSEERWTRRESLDATPLGPPWSTYVYLAAATFAASLINPYGFRLHEHLVRYLFDSQQLGLIAEFQSINFRVAPSGYIEIVLLEAAIAAFWFLRRGRWGWTAWLLFWCHLTLQSRRSAAYLACMTAPLFGVAYHQWQLSWETPGVPDKHERASRWATRLPQRIAEAASAFWNEYAPLEEIPRAHLLPAIVMGALTWALLHPTGADSPFHASYSAHEFPVNAVEHLDLTLDTHIFAKDQWGDYLIYRHGPRIPVFTDDRSDFYGGEFCGDWARALRGGPNGSHLLDRYQISTVLTSPEDGLTQVLEQSPGWTRTYGDETAIVFRRRRMRLPPGSEAVPKSGHLRFRPAGLAGSPW